MSIILSSASLAQVPVKVRIFNIEKNGGEIHLSVFNNDTTFKSRKPYKSVIVSPTDSVVIHQMVLDKGFCLFSAFQDNNKNGKLDTNLMGIPKEKFGFSKYDGKSVPGNFSKHRVLIKDNDNEIPVTLFKIF